MDDIKKESGEKAGFLKQYGFYIALAVLAAIVLMPPQEGLSVAGQRMI